MVSGRCRRHSPRTCTGTSRRSRGRRSSRGRRAGTRCACPTPRAHLKRRVESQIREPCERRASRAESWNRAGQRARIQLRPSYSCSTQQAARSKQEAASRKQQARANRRSKCTNLIRRIGRVLSRRQAIARVLAQTLHPRRQGARVRADTCRGQVAVVEFCGSQDEWCRAGS